MKKLYSLAALFLLSTVLTFGQGANGTITGTVTDPSGAVLANAQIQAKNNANGQVYTAVSTATGNYSVQSLPVGAYDLTATVAGFKTYNRVGLDLAAAQIMRIDIGLEVGAVGDSVTVTAEASLLKTESSELVHNVTVSQMTSLPILSVGGTGTAASSGFRDPFALAQMIPGINYGANATMVVNGVPDDTIQIRIEGQVAGNTGNLRQYTGQTQPSVDAVQEVAVQTSNYAAEFGTAGGGVFNMTMKSGTNQFHGTAYDYSANEALNAAQPYTGLLTKTRRFDYGFTIGGPVRIPKIYDGKNKTFFFWSWEQFREKLNITSTLATVPTQAYRNGDFSGLFAASGNNLLKSGTANYIDPLGNTIQNGAIFDPATTTTVNCPATGSTCTPGSSLSYRTAFAGNQIPVARFDPVSVNVIKLVPLPEGPNAAKGQIGNNYQRPWASKRTSTLPSLKIDQTIGANGRLSGYWQDTGTTSPYSFPNGNGEGLPEPITQARGTFIYTRTIRVNYDHTLTPTMLLHVGAGWFHNNFDDHSPVLDTFGPVNTQTLLGLPNPGIIRQFPSIVTAASTALGGMNALGPQAGQGNSFERRPSGVVNLSEVRGNHSIKFGAEYRLEKYPPRGFTNVTGNYNFGINATQQTALQGVNLSQGTTGFQLASFMLGGASGITMAQPLAAGTSKSQWALFLQDTWKVTRKLTLDYGLRWDYGTYAKEQYGRYANFSPTVANPSAGGHPGGQIYEAQCNCKFAANYPYGIGPRVGLAYQINSKTVVRGGFGMVYTGTTNASGSATNSADAGTPGFGLTVGQFQNGIPAAVLAQARFPNFDVNAGQPNGGVVAAPTVLDPNAGRPAKQYQWSIGIQREINKDLVVEASYVGNRGVWWTGSNLTNAGSLSAQNVISPTTLSQYGFSLNSATDGTLLNKQISALTAAEKSTLLARGVNLPYANYSTGQTVRQSLLPFPQYNTSMAPTGAPLGKTWYDALQINVTQRFAHGIQFGANYTASKNFELMSSPDIFNRSMGKDLSQNDIPQQLRINAQYTTQSLKNSGIKGLNNRWVSYALADWGIGAYMQYQSAPVLARPISLGSQPISQWLGRGPGNAQWDGTTSLFSTNWTDYSGKVHTDPIDVNCHCFDPTTNLVLNPAAWSNIPNGQWGAQQTTIRQYRNIRQPQENLNVSRNFRIKEGVVLHIRAEFQNVFNRTRLTITAASAGNATATGFSAATTKFTSGATAGLYSGGFGTILPTSGTSGQRTGTLIARITF